MTHLELRNRIGDWFGANSKRVAQTVRTDILNITIRELCRQWDLRLNEVTETFDTVGGQNAYDLPALWRGPYELWYIDTATQSGLSEVDFLLLDEFDNLYPDPTKTGKPKHYTTWGSSLYFGPTPNAVITMHHYYYGYMADLVNDGDHNAFTDQAWEVVLFKALGDTTRYGIEDERIPVWMARGKELEMQLVNADARAKSMGRRPVGVEP